MDQNHISPRKLQFKTKIKSFYSPLLPEKVILSKFNTCVLLFFRLKKVIVTIEIQDLNSKLPERGNSSKP